MVVGMMNRINKHQLFSLMFIFEVGSTTLFALGIKAKQDAWLAILAAMVIGLFLVWIYTELQKDFPDKNFVEIINFILGKWLGIPLSLLYISFWLWPTARNLREFGELILLTILPNTPLNMILLTFMMSSLYIILLGIQVIGRTSEITMPLIVFFILSLFIMLLISGNVHLKNLSPVLAKGIKPVLSAAYPTIANFPFGEILIFSMYWCYLDDKTIIRKITIHAVVLSGLLLSFTLAIYVSALGTEYTTISTIPFIEVVKMIDIGEFLTNLDAISACVIFLGGFYKMTIYLNGITIALATTLKIKNSKLLTVIVAFFVLWISIIFEPNYTYHKWMSPFDANFFNTPFLHVIPLLLLLIYWIRKRTNKHAS
jgi:spore germination protein KB